MEISTAAPSAPDGYAPAGGPIHTIGVLALIVVWAFLGFILADHMRAAANPHRVRMYVHTILFEWLLFAFVVVGVRRSGTPIHVVLGDRWHSIRQVLRDIGIAAGFWIGSGVLLVILGMLLRVTASGRTIGFMLPQGALEITLWIALSVTAGVCEETIFRGYLQRQFLALTNSAPAGILLSGAAFGVAHAYQGFRRTILIGLYGLMFGILAYWRKSVRPGMIAHAWQDSLVGLLSGIVRH